MSWTNQLQIAITVTDENGTITEMNPASAEVFAADGGSRLIGSDVFACHSEASRAQLTEMYQKQQPNHYTIQKNGRRKIIHQLPLFDGSVFKGYVEISIPIPNDLPHHNRD